MKSWPFVDAQTWHVGSVQAPFTGSDLRKFYDAIGTQRIGNGSVPHLVGGSGGSDRRVDRALQLLKRAGLIAFVNGRWIKTEKDGE